MRQQRWHRRDRSSLCAQTMTVMPASSLRSRRRTAVRAGDIRTPSASGRAASSIERVRHDRATMATTANAHSGGRASPMPRRQPASVSSSAARARAPTMSPDDRRRRRTPGFMYSRTLPSPMTSTWQPRRLRLEQRQPSSRRCMRQEEEVRGCQDASRGRDATACPDTRRPDSGPARGQRRPVTDNDEAMGDAVPVEERTECLDVIESALTRRRHHAEELPAACRRHAIRFSDGSDRRAGENMSLSAPPGQTINRSRLQPSAPRRCRASADGTSTRRQSP